MDKLKGFLVIVILLIVGLGIWFVSVCFSDKKTEENNPIVDNDYSDVTNVPVIDKKLGNDVKITQSYLMKYTINKTGIWYMSYGKISNVKVTKNSIIYTFSDGRNSIDGSISKSDGIYEKGNNVYFVGTINLSDGIINLSTVSMEEINYSSPVNIEISELIKHVNDIRDTDFLIQGYLVTDNNEYKLFDSKDDYKDDSSAGNYFLLSMNKDFNYTGNAFVTLRCNIDGTYKLRNCSLEE